jgi:antitoxin ParD1/3/4
VNQSGASAGWLHALPIVDKIWQNRDNYPMSYAVGNHFEDFIRAQVQAGRFNNASEVVREGLRLLEERELKIAELRSQVQAAIADEKRYTMDEVMAEIEQTIQANLP